MRTVESKRLFLFGGCAPAGAKALDDIGFAPMGAVDRSYRCAPRLNAPLESNRGLTGVTALLSNSKQRRRRATVC